MLVRQRPEFVVKLNEREYWLIEAKGDVAELEKAFAEACAYGADVNRSELICARIVTGIAGTEPMEMLVKTAFLEEDGYHEVTYNGEEITSILTKERVRQLLESQSAVLQDLVADERLFLSVAEDINQVLHDGSINKSARSKVVSALILAMIDQGEIDLRADCQVFIDSINSRACQMLRKYNKESFFDSVRLYLPEKESAKQKYKEALIKTHHLLQKIDIHAAMYSGTDVLGKFYEVFLKYGNGAKDIGIVLTPRHITRFACEAMNIQYTDLVYDPTCGTGGFLVAAFDYVRQHATKEQTQVFKEHRIFGIELDSAAATMAIINMIFRGDGRSNIINDDCFAERLRHKIIEGTESAEYVLSDGTKELGTEAVTKVLMNPPFSKTSEAEKEYRFIQHALDQMRPGGMLFSVIPTSVLIKGGKLKDWRQHLLAENTLLAIVSFPEDLFYPVGIRTVGIFIKKGVAHNYQKDRVLWAKTMQDGFVKSKGKRLLDARVDDELKVLQPYLKMHLYDTAAVRENLPERMKLCCIQASDENVELMPEVYLDEATENADQLFAQAQQYVREYLAFLIKRGEQLALYVQEETDGWQLPKNVTYGTVRLSEFGREVCYSGCVHSVPEVGEGQWPLISCKTEDNGIAGYCDVEPEQCTHHCLTIAGDGSFPLTTYYHAEPIVSYDNVTILPLRYDLPLELIFFLASRLNRSRWRYSYGRKCYVKKVRELTVRLPVNGKGEPDVTMIQKMFSQMYGWKEIASFIGRRMNTVSKDNLSHSQE